MSILEFQYLKNEYPIYLVKTKVGNFIEEYNPARKVSIQLDKIVLDNLYDIRFAYFSQYEQDGMLDDKATREWINRRVFPKTRMNKDNLLKEMGLSEYDQIEILKWNMGTCAKDQFWIKFEDVEFEDICPNYRAVLNNKFWGYDKGFVPKTYDDLGLNKDVVFSHRNDR